LVADQLGLEKVDDKYLEEKNKIMIFVIVCLGFGLESGVPVKSDLFSIECRILTDRSLESLSDVK
jgi:hypothetical protein